MTLLPPIHRVITGHDAQGKAVVASSGPLPTVAEIAAIPGTVFHEVWSTAATRAARSGALSPSAGSSAPASYLSTRRTSSRRRCARLVK